MKLQLFFAAVTPLDGSIYCAGGGALVRAESVEHAAQLLEADGRAEALRVADDLKIPYEQRALCIWPVEDGDAPGVLFVETVSE